MEVKGLDEKRGVAEKGFPAKLHDWSSDRKAITFLALWLVNAVLLQVLDNRLAILANGETKLDLRFGYDFQTVLTIFTGYGEQGRDLYLSNLAIDTLMPLFLALATITFTTLAFRKSRLVTLLVIVPAAFFIGDVIENVLLVTLVASFPDIDPNMIRLASAVTRPKLIAAMMTYALLILSAVILASRYARNLLTRGRVSSRSQ